MHTLDSTRGESRLKRDLRLLGRMAAMLYGYFAVGGRLRREYRRRERRGEMLWLDDVGPTRHREEPLRHR
ncbi:MAG TPA: hypothetical protein VFQ51_07375 [Vicinamibacteria bacterium]|nr:hypothetical protein [Vicinamibacteria bacterium]